MAGEATPLKAGDATPLKSVAIVLGALAFGWAAIELAFKPLFGKGKSDPSPAADAVDAVETKAKELAKEVEDAAADAGVSSA
ncbi:hypothetical protein Tco_1383204 [Tanacetum coccineum]